MIFRREQAVGLSTTAYLLAKVMIFALFASLQSAIVVVIAVLGKKWGPGAVTTGAAMNRTLELYIDIAATCVVAAMVGLALSALAKSNEADNAAARGGGDVAAGVLRRMIPATGRIARPLITPARGFVSSAATVALGDIVPPPITP